MSDDKSDESTSSSPGLEVLMFILGAVVLAYIGGAFSAAFQTFPYPQLLERPFEALKARQEKEETTEGSVLDTGLWEKARYQQSGVVHHDPAAAYEGYTLLSSAHTNGAVLLDMKGKVVHKWIVPFREVWPDPPHIDDPVPASRIYWRRMHLFPNGDIIASYSGEGDTPYGYGLVRVDKDGEVVWKYAGHVHHDFQVLDDGSIVALTHEWRHTKKNPVHGVPQLEPVILEDFLVKLSPEGEELDKMSLLEAMVDSPFRQHLDRYPNFIDKGFEAKWDPLHNNTVSRVGADFAEHHDWAEPGQFLVSYRNNDTVGLVDFDQKKLVWASRGVWQQQHDPDPLPNGNILVFDNNGHGGLGGGSRIVEYNPATGAVEWFYVGQAKMPFWSLGRGYQEVLPNGNVLITESEAGRVFEITRKGEPVWIFDNPARRKRGDTVYAATICGAERFGADELDFLEP